MVDIALNEDNDVVVNKIRFLIKQAIRSSKRLSNDLQSTVNKTVLLVRLNQGFGIPLLVLNNIINDMISSGELIELDK